MLGPLRLLCLLTALSSVSARAEPKADPFVRQEAMIAMRDGTRLHTVIFVPRAHDGPLPILLQRTPYKADRGQDWARQDYYQELVTDGYIFVWQNLRGRGKSEGDFVLLRPPRNRRDSRSVDEATDAYDTVDWLIKHVPDNNGRVGILGVSYAGWAAAMTLLEPHPAVKAVSAQAAPADAFLGDDFHRNGAFSLDEALDFCAAFSSGDGTTSTLALDRPDAFDWHLRLGPLARADVDRLQGRSPLWQDFVSHPARDAFWQARAFRTFLRGTKVPLLVVGGWFDQEDMDGPLELYRLASAASGAGWTSLALGPWEHAGWWDTGAGLGPLSWGSSTGTHFRKAVQAPWLAYWLHGKGRRPEPGVLSFQTGSNEWKAYDRWPPTRGSTKRLYLRAGGRASFAPPEEAAALDSFVSDPADPVPYQPRPIPPIGSGNAWARWLLADQRFAAARADVLSWSTDPLPEDVTVTGDLGADLFASTSGTDADWVVKLIDAYPEGGREEVSPGYQLIVAAQAFRGRFRSGFDKPAPLIPDHPLEYLFPIHARDHVFRKGHRIMVQVQSSWFPLIDRNPQRFVDNIFEARESDFVKATQRIYRDRNEASSVTLPIVGAPALP